MTRFLPEKIYLHNYANDWTCFMQAVYEVFKKDFIETRPNFRGKRLGLKRHPERDGKSATFWHMTTIGEVESERELALERCQRIPWPRPIIENSTNTALKVWAEPIGTSRRIHIWLEVESYLVVLDDRREYILPWTAFYVEKEHQRKKYNKRWQKYGSLT